MPSCEAQCFTEPDQYAAAVRGARVDLTVTGRGRFNANHVGLDLGALRLQRISKDLPTIAHMTNMGGRASFMFHTQPGPAFVRDGAEVTSDSVVRRLRGPYCHFQRTTGPENIGTIAFELKDIPSVSEIGLGFDLSPPLREQVITPQPDGLASLRRQHEAAAMLATTAPELLESPEVVRGIEQMMLQALAACLDGDTARESTSTQRRHQKIMRRFHAVLQANPTRPLYVLEIATAVGASLRSLTLCCQECLGISPKKYLLLRRMHLARQALVVADPNKSSVTDVATQYGFWQFGRFAGHYKMLFGELPSVTLRSIPPR